MTAILLVIYAVTGACLIDAIRRPMGQWAEADRDKSYWVTMLVVSAVLLLPAPFFVPAYVFGVLPHFSAQASRSPSPFDKDMSS
jgi:hypothetical protein